MIVIASLDGAIHRSVALRIRRIRRRLPGLRIGVALWPGPAGTGEGDPFRDGADFVAVGMEAVLGHAFSAAA